MITRCPQCLTDKKRCHIESRAELTQGVPIFFKTKPLIYDARVTLQQITNDTKHLSRVLTGELVYHIIW